MILVLFFVFLHSTLILIINILFRPRLVDISVTRICSCNCHWARRLGIGWPYDDTFLIPPSDSSVHIINDAGLIIETVGEDLAWTFRTGSSHCSVRVIDRFATIRILFNWEILEVLLTIEWLRLWVIAQEKTIVVHSNSSINECLDHCSVSKFVII